MVGSDPDRVGAGQWTAVSGEKKGGWGMGNPSGFLGTSRGWAKEWGERAARVLSDAFPQARNLRSRAGRDLPDKIGTGQSGLPSDLRASSASDHVRG
jgi:hypothetical protein